MSCFVRITNRISFENQMKEVVFDSQILFSFKGLNGIYEELKILDRRRRRIRSEAKRLRNKESFV